MNQTTFNFESLSRRLDPPSSKRAARKMVESGALRNQSQIAFDALKHHPRNSTKRLHEITGLDRHMLARRCSDLRRKGHALEVRIGKRDMLYYAIFTVETSK